MLIRRQRLIVAPLRIILRRRGSQRQRRGRRLRITQRQLLKLLRTLALEQRLHRRLGLAGLPPAPHRNPRQNHCRQNQAGQRRFAILGHPLGKLLHVLAGTRRGRPLLSGRGLLDIIRFLVHDRFFLWARESGADSRHSAIKTQANRCPPPGFPHLWKIDECRAQVRRTPGEREFYSGGAAGRASEP